MIEPYVTDMYYLDDSINFTISNIDVSLANAIRRTILCDIPMVVIRTFPYDKNDATFDINTSSFNNEILKQRLSCIPIFINDSSINLEDYLVEIDVKNTVGHIISVTTEDFKIKNIKTNKYLLKDTLIKIFPPNSITKHFIEFCRLKPAYLEDTQGEHIKIFAKLAISSAKENGSFNSVSTCLYKNTPDKYAIEEAKRSKLEDLRSKYSNDEQIQHQLTDWINLDAKRIYIPDSFDFKIKSIGVFTNQEIIIKAITIIIEKLLNIKDIYSRPNDLINPSENTIDNCFDITLIDEDYTIGKILEYWLHKLYYIDDKTITFCGFNKPHPHINTSIIRIAFTTNVEKSVVVSYLTNSVDYSIVYFKKLLPHFGELNPDEALDIKSSIPSIPQTEISIPQTEPSIKSTKPSTKKSKIKQIVTKL